MATPTVLVLLLSSAVLLHSAAAQKPDLTSKLTEAAYNHDLAAGAQTHSIASIGLPMPFQEVVQK